MFSRSFERKIWFFYLQLWPWRQFVSDVFASRDIARRTRAPAPEGKERDYTESVEERQRRTPLLWLVHSLKRFNTNFSQLSFLLFASLILTGDSLESTPFLSSYFQNLQAFFQLQKLQALKIYEKLEHEFFRKNTSRAKTDEKRKIV